MAAFEHIFAWVTSSWISLLSLTSAALATWFFKPLIESKASNILNKTPRFGVTDAYKGPSNIIVVQALNKPAKKALNLNIVVDGVLIPGGCSLVRKGKTYSWDCNLNSSPLVRHRLENSESVLVAFFFDGGTQTTPEKISFRQYDSTHDEHSKRREVACTDLDDFILNLRSNTKISISNDIRLAPDDNHVNINNSIRWNRVYDGRELQIFDLKNLSIEGKSNHLSAEPRYAWVLSFTGCDGLELSGMTAGHTEEGFCQGGVFRLERSSLSRLDGLDMYGCGTQGLELVSCNNVTINRSTIRDCTYGIMTIRDCEDIVFNGCIFQRNSEFYLVEILGDCKRISFNNCVFKNNHSNYSMFFAGDVANISEIILSGCTFEHNSYTTFASEKGIIGIESSHFSNNVIGSPRNSKWGAS